MKLLVVDDDADLLDNIRIILDIAGYEVFCAENGLTGLRLALEQDPELIISDIMMPEMTGYELLEELQSNTATAAIPFIFLSSQSELEDIRRGMGAGADDYLTKPFTEASLLTAIQKRLEKRQLWELEQRIRFNQQLIQKQEDDLAKISEELEQTLRQKLLHLKNWTDAQAHNPNASKEFLYDAVQKSLNEALAQVNRISYRIYPSMLPQLGLILSLQWFFSTQIKAPVKFEVYGMESRLRFELELGIYRIIQRFFEYLESFSEAPRLVLWRDESTFHLSLSQLPSMDKEDYWHLFQLLEEYAHAIQASLVIRHEEKQTALYLTLQNAIFQSSLIHEQPQYLSGQNINILAVSADPSFLGRLQNDAGLGFKLIPHLFTDIDSLFQQINHRHPQIIILDLMLSNDVLKLLKQKSAIIVLSPDSDASFARQILEQGINAIIPKQKAERELLPAIQTILRGEAYISASLLLNANETQTKANLNLGALLTLREREILDLILEDLTHSDIADKLVISPRTVEKHRANIMQKLGIKTHTELILFALRHDLISS
jgi:DNA-binding NarL/FixJ family response regulator